MSDPQVRALLVQNNVLALSRLGAERRERVLARWGSEAADAVVGASRLAWLPVRHDVTLASALEAEIGPEAVRQWARDGFATTLDAPMLRALVDSALRLFRSSPADAYRWVCRGWTILFRDCGQLEVERSDATSCLLLVRDAAPEIRVRAYLAGMAESLSVPLSLFQAEGSVDLVVGLSLRFLVRWHMKS